MLVTNSKVFKVQGSYQAMYFDAAPKTERKDLFGVDYVLHSLVAHLQDKQVRLIVIKGLRRTGKTSLLNVALPESGQEYVKIDAREAPHHHPEEFLHYLAEKIKAAVGESLFQKITKQIEKVEFSYKDIGAAFYLKKQNLSFFLEKLNHHMQSQKKYFILAIDEAQLLHKIDFDNILAAIYDNYRNIKIILTGSEIGLLDRFLGRKDVTSPLFGRAVIEIQTKKLEPEQVNQFLEDGFHQIRKEISLREAKDVIETLDGIIGWATHYGWLRARNMPHLMALQNVVDDGTKLTRSELDAFLTKRSKTAYLRILRWLGSGHNRWGLLKHRFIQSAMPISDRQLNLYLTELQEYGFIEKISETYFISDPLLMRALPE